MLSHYRKILSQKTVKNITYSRTGTDEDILEDFFSNLQEKKYITPKNVWNYDETNSVDDPRAKKAITRRGAKYPKPAHHLWSVEMLQEN